MTKKAPKFREFISEEKEKPYKLVLLTHSGAGIRDTKDDPDTRFELSDAAEKLGLTVFRADFVGAYTKKVSGKRLLYSFPFDKNNRVVLPDSQGNKIEYQKPFECNPEDTLIFPRGLGTLGFTSSRAWYDMMKQFEYDGFTIINPLECYDICTSKYLSYIAFTNNKINTPKTVPIAHSEDTERAFKELKTDFPVILKSSTGTQTGVGVVIVESLRSLNAIVQMILLYNKYLPIIIQEYIKTDYDIRVVVCGGEIIGAIKRNVITGDVRSNVSLGADAEPFELTDLEASESIRIAAATKCILAGVDLIPSKNREKEKPYCIEVNSNLGFGGVESVLKGSPTKTILKKLSNRSLWANA
jgi:RimK family alpha-L-glutamate ligase